MKPSKQLLKVLGFSLMAALSLTVLSVASAQAAGGVFKVLGGTLNTEETFTGELEEDATLLIPKINLEVTCKKLDFLEGKLFKDGLGQTKLLFLECFPYSISPLSKISNCSVPNNDITVDVLILASLWGEPLVPYILAKAKSVGGPLATIVFTGEKCALPPSIEIKGTVGGTIPEEEAITQLVKFSQAIQEGLLFDSLKYGLHSAFVDGSGKATLTGANKGCKWGAV